MAFRISIREESTPGFWKTVFQGSATEVRAYLSGLYQNPAQSLRWGAFRAYGGEGATRRRMSAAELSKCGAFVPAGNAGAQ